MMLMLLKSTECKTARKSTFKKKWSANEIAARMTEQTEFNERFQSQASKLGLGHGNFSNNPHPRRTSYRLPVRTPSQRKKKG